MKSQLTAPKPAGPAFAPSALAEEVERRLAVAEPDVELLAAEVGSGRGSRSVRIFVDQPGGVTHETCARVTNHLADLLGGYSIEVSSPGPRRPLTKPAHFQRFVGRRTRVTTQDPIDGRTDFKGELIAADDDGVTLAGDWGTVTIDYERIHRSNLIPGGDAQ